MTIADGIRAIKGAQNRILIRIILLWIGYSIPMVKSVNNANLDAMCANFNEKKAGDRSILIPHICKIYDQ